MKKTRTTKLTVLDVVAKIVDSDLPISTRNEITRHYMLPKLGYTQAIVELNKSPISSVERPDVDEIRIENNPRLKAEDEETEKLLSKL